MIIKVRVELDGGQTLGYFLLMHVGPWCMEFAAGIRSYRMLELKERWGKRFPQEHSDKRGTVACYLQTEPSQLSA